MKTKFLSVFLMEKFDLFNQSESFLNILHNFFQRHYKCYLLCCFHSKIPSYFFLNLTRYTNTQVALQAKT